jgi:ubiquitin carboxyl-terminal hydrolase 4/11/15
MQIYKAPPILVINLKRFRHSQGQSSRFANMYSGGGSQKIEVNVDFPLEGLDMSRFILGREAKENPSQYIYDCYAVSNHYGGLGFGHYTAYAKNPLTERWYEFDDSRVSAIAPHAVASQVRSKAAYNLFYRRRDWHARNMAQGVDFEALAIRPENF